MNEHRFYQLDDTAEVWVVYATQGMRRGNEALK